VNNVERLVLLIVSLIVIFLVRTGKYKKAILLLGSIPEGRWF